LRKGTRWLLDDELGLTTLSAEIEDEEAKDRAVYDE
jgi:hypothetical protein